MTYRINKFDGTVLTDVIDGTVDQITTDLTLVGSDVAGYGELLNENFVHLLENFSNPDAPPNPITGQLWYDTTESLLKIYNGSSFVKVSSNILENSTTFVSPKPGDIWIKADKEQLFFHDGKSFKLAGPVYSSDQGKSGFEIVTAKEGTVDHTVVCLWCKGQLIGLFSNHTFTPSNSIYTYTGTQVNAGFTFINPNPYTNGFNLYLDKIELYTDNTEPMNSSFIRAGRSVTTYPPDLYTGDLAGQTGDPENDVDIIIQPGVIPVGNGGIVGVINTKGSRISRVGLPVDANDAVPAAWVKINISRSVAGISQFDAILTIVDELIMLAPESDYVNNVWANILCYGNGDSYVFKYVIANGSWTFKFKIEGGNTYKLVVNGTTKEWVLVE